MSILWLAFNKPTMSITCTTQQGYISYRLDPNLEKVIYNDLNGGVGIMRIYNKSNIAVLVGGGDRPFKPKDTLILHDQKKKQNLVEIDMKETIRNSFIINEKMIGVLERKICIFDWSGAFIDSKVTYLNEKGICVMANEQERPILASLGTKKGEIAIWSLKDNNYKTIQAHNSNIDVIALNSSGKLVATASETGTVIRVFNTDTGNMEYEFRRGSKQAKIFDICFNKDSTVMACYSSNGTVHMFELYTDINQTKNSQSVLSGLKEYLPEYFSSQWGFKQLTVGNSNRAIMCFDDSNNLHVVLFDGDYYKISYSGNQYDDISQGNLHINNK